MSLSIPSVPPTGYLSLPLELRQQILFESLAKPYEKDRDFNKLLERARLLLGILERLRKRCHAPSIYDWASVLDSSHEWVRLDLKFVLKVKLRDFQRDFAMAYPTMIKWDCGVRRWFWMVYGGDLAQRAGISLSRMKLRAAMGDESSIVACRVIYSCEF